MNFDFLENLNEKQKEAVTYCDGSSLIIAGAGSGKTKVLTSKIVYLLTQGLAPHNILALTFTNKAAREMKERIASMTDSSLTSQLWIGTFHSVFSIILRREAATLGFERNYTIYDSADTRSLIKSIVKELNLDEKAYKPNVIASRISDAKNKLLLPSDYANNAELLKKDKRHQIGSVFKIYELYAEKCRKSNALDFDDLLLYTYKLFDEHEEALHKYQNYYKYILVDEYQDTNYAQDKIINKLASDGTPVCVVGDDAQSIYGFRGADIGNILGFTQNFPTAKLIKLEYNYRSTQNIVNAANCVIEKNKNRIPKTIISHNQQQGNKIKVYAAHSDKEESSIVAREIQSLHQKKRLEYNNIAILYRTNAQSRSFEEALQNYSIPYVIYGGLSFYQRKEIKDIIAYFRVICNPKDDEAMLRIINYPARGIGKTTVAKLLYLAQNNNVNLYDAMRNCASHGASFSKGTLNKINNFKELMESLMQSAKEKSAYETAVNILSASGIKEDLENDKTPEGIGKRENAEELLNSIKLYEDETLEENGKELVLLSDYLPHVALLTDQDNQNKTDTPKITLMTVHASKGLEYEAVFVTGMENDLFPNINAKFSPREMEEERRLFYVAITRAKTYCYLAYALSRFKYGDVCFNEPSHFIEEIDKQYLEYENAPTESDNIFLSPQKSAKPKDFSDKNNFVRYEKSAETHSYTETTYNQQKIKIGTIIEHFRFGIGKILNIEGDNSEKKIQVDFENFGEKNLLLKFAKFTIIKE